nr:5'-methylthioadenosine nucleosidase [Burkholderia oklahomensis EO147]
MRGCKGGTGFGAIADASSASTADESMSICT